MKTRHDVISDNIPKESELLESEYIKRTNIEKYTFTDPVFGTENVEYHYDEEIYTLPEYIQILEDNHAKDIKAIEDKYNELYDLYVSMGQFVGYLKAGE